MFSYYILWKFTHPTPSHSHENSIFSCNMAQGCKLKKNHFQSINSHSKGLKLSLAIWLKVASLFYINHLQTVWQLHYELLEIRKPSTIWCPHSAQAGAGAHGTGADRLGCVCVCLLCVGEVWVCCSKGQGSPF